MTRYTKILTLLSLGLASAGVGIFAYSKFDKPAAPVTTSDSVSSPPSPTITRSLKNGMSTTRELATDDVIDPQDWLENGPKEPIEPREIHVEAELAPGSVQTNEPLVPREIHVDVELAPGSSTTLEPLTPREIQVTTPMK